MQPIFILIRGNSGSGKTTLSDKLQQHFGYEHCLLLHQDVIRRDILHTHDHVGTPAIQLIEQLVKFGSQHYQIIILEGILKKDVYGNMLDKLIRNFDKSAFAYYLDVPFSVTVRHNNLKATPFTVNTLKKWWLTDDSLISTREYKLNNGNTSDFFKQIITDITNSSIDIP